MSPKPPMYLVSGFARIQAPPARIYNLIADYHVGHPSILPKQFSNMRVEAGGVGAGTIVRFDVTVLGRTQTFRAVVSEPQPGRILVERNVEPNDSETTFTVAPEDGGQAATVSIVTALTARTGLSGAIERFISTRVLKSMYAEELRILAQRAEST